MIISDTQINKNFDLYCQMLQSTKEPGIDDLIAYLETTDFRIAPASTKYHYNIRGGLCAHSLNVYSEIYKLPKLYVSDDEFNTEQFQRDLILAALLHDISKTFMYKSFIKNVKKYSDRGAHKDDIGKFDWVQEQSYTVRDMSERENLYGDHGLNSYMIAARYIKLDESVTIAIMNHHLSLDNNGKTRTDITEILNRHPLATLLSLADTVSAYIVENPYIVESNE